MTIMESKKTSEGESARQDEIKSEQVQDAPEVKVEGKPDNMFDNKNLPKSTKVSDKDVSKDVLLDMGNSTAVKPITITPEDKIRFIDAVVNNTRFTKDYKLFGGRVALTVRSLTSEEVQAIAAWIVRQGTSDPSGQISGRYRKYLAAAQISRYNGIDMPPLAMPLFPALETDGKTVKEPGWLGQCDFWDGIGSGIFQAIMVCLSDFDAIYATMCKKAEDANFWSPDTP